MEVSNKTLIGLLAIVITISLIGTFISLNKLGSITGLQANVTSDSGTTSVAVLSTAQLTLYNKTMDFGSGQINGSAHAYHDYCNLTSNATITSAGNTFTGLGSGSKDATCIGTGWKIPWSFVIENTGNVAFTTVNMTSTGGNLDFNQNFTSQVTNGTWAYKMDEEATGACTENEAAVWADVPGATPATVCSAFASSPATGDAFLIQMKVALPEDAAAKTWSNTVTFTGKAP